MRIPALACIAVAVLLRADSAWCQEEKAAGELDRWIPSLGISMGALRQGADGFQVNNMRPPDDEFPPPGPFPGTPSDGNDYLLDPFTVFNVEMMSPGIDSLAGIESVPGHPRLFVRGEIGGIFGSDVPLAQESSPGSFTLPPPPPPAIPPAPVPPPLSPLSVGGQGTRTEVTTDALVASVGMGVAFTADLLDRRFRVKPSFEYLRNGVTADGEVRHVTGNWPAGAPNPNFNFIVLHPQESRTLNHLGGGLELEVDTVRLGPFVIAVFANGRAYQLLDDREINLTSTDGTNTARWDVKLDRATFLGSAGLRFRFFPAKD